MYPVLQDATLKGYLEFHAAHPSITATKPPG
jgi:hypothetical protein